MIRVRCLGHIATSVGAKELLLDEDEMDAAALVDRLRGMSRERDPGFTGFNTLVLFEDGDAFVPAGTARQVKDGDQVALIPISHGG